MKLPKRSYFLPLLFTAISFPTYALTLDEYLGQVRLNNEGVRGAKLGEEAKSLRSDEASLVFKPAFFFNAEYSDDKRPTIAPSFQGNRTIRETYSAGLQQSYRTGTKAAISYNIYKTDIRGSQVALPMFYDVMPKVEVSQSLWRNWLGGEVKATETAQNAQLQANRLNDQFNLKQLLIKAENAYWRLVFAEESLKVQKESAARAIKLRDWNSNRVKNNLVDEADYLQAEANLQSRELDVETASIELETAKKEFNSVRQSNEDITLASNSANDRAFLLNAKLPEKSGTREDVLIAIENQKLVAANSSLGFERNKPTFDVYGAYSFNGRTRDYGDAYNMADDGKNSWLVYGLRFTTPLDFGSLSDYRKGYVQEKVAAELNARRKTYEVDREYDILSQRFDQFKKRLKLSKRMEEVQLKKLNAEKRRFTQGRTTTFQVLQFEQDYANTQLLTIRNESELVAAYNQLKLYTGVSHE
jgi:outer membrane protein TolC